MQIAFRVALAALSCSAMVAGAQTKSIPAPRPPSFVLVTDESVDRARSNQLIDSVAVGQSLLLRSASSLTPPLPIDRGFKAVAIGPQFLFVSNSSLPFSQNYGALWAGKGLSSRTLVGFRLESSRFRLIVAPELISSANSDWLLRQPQYQAPAIPVDRSGGGYVFPFYVASAWSIDQPMRFGNRPIRRLDPGQSTFLVSARSMQFGISNENEWWGPGIRNAIVLSNNAPGFPHLFLRTGHPIETRFGAVEMRWLVGGLTESKYFDTVSNNNVRSLASFATTIQTGWNPNLSFGFARSVYSTATGWGQVPWRWFDILARTADTGNATLQDAASSPIRKEQLFSLFARLVLPADGVEIYTEWARNQFNPTLRDLFVQPNNSQGYTLGLQWRGAQWHQGSFRLQTEVTQLEQSATFRDQPLESWYMSSRVIQGYTNRGEILGASIGPGASSQWLAIDYLKPSWRLGAFVGRIRWNEDVHSTAKFPVYVGYCNHDVSLYPGIRGAKSGALGTFTADLSFQNRLNAFFQNEGGCPNIGPRLDIRNKTVSITFSPFASR